jgi:hypothetical protein
VKATSREPFDARGVDGNPTSFAPQPSRHRSAAARGQRREGVAVGSASLESTHHGRPETLARDEGCGELRCHCDCAGRRALTRIDRDWQTTPFAGRGRVRFASGIHGCAACTEANVLHLGGRDVAVAAARERRGAWSTANQARAPRE